MCSVAGLDRNTVDRLCRSLGAGRLSMRTAKFKFAKSPSRRVAEARKPKTWTPARRHRCAGDHQLSSSSFL